jgi:putative acetyltransferase
MIRLEQIVDANRMDAVRAMFREYQASIGVDLCFQGFEAELASLPGTYAAPGGRLLLAYVDDACAGCIALRPLKDGRAGQDCEMKRLYVRPNHRGQRIGRLLAERVLRDAREFGYRRIVLDTMSGMHAAQAMYRSLGFIEIAPYYVNPLPDISYMQLDLGNS